MATGDGEGVRASGNAAFGRGARALCARWLQPRAAAEEARRRESVLNAFLLGALLLGSVAALAVAVGLATRDVSLVFGLSRIAMVSIWIGACVVLLRWSRRGRLRRASIGLVLLYGGTCLFAVANWSLLLPSSLILAAVLVVLIVVLLEGRSAHAALAAFLGTLMVLDGLQLSGVLHPDVSWLSEPPAVPDSLLSFALLAILALVSIALRRELQTPIGELVSHGAENSPLARSRTGTLTVREVEVTQLVADGLPASEIAARLFISTSTVNTHVSRALSKTGCMNRTELAVLALREGLVPLKPGATAELPVVARDPDPHHQN